MKEKIISFIFIGFIFIFSIFLIFKEDNKLSLIERRKLTTKAQLKEDFIENLDKYMIEQFPFRNELIKVNNLYNRHLLNNFEHNNVYLQDGFIIEKNYPLDEKSIENFTNKINKVSEYINWGNVYYMVIPDKSYYLNDKYLKIDYDYLFNKLEQDLKPKYINVENDFELNDYFKTDIHLKQEAYFKILPKLLTNFNIEYTKEDYKINKYYPFYGSSYSKYGLLEPDELTYYTSELTKSALVKHLEYNTNKVYEKEELESIDSYNVFLSGPSSFIEINTNSNTNKELIIFRDSFASSLAPLLIPYYKKITLVDLRYIDFSLTINELNLETSDILFIYSPLIINNSSVLKVKY